MSYLSAIQYPSFGEVVSWLWYRMSLSMRRLSLAFATTENPTSPNGTPQMNHQKLDAEPLNTTLLSSKPLHSLS